jgi:hypothetical protein
LRGFADLATARAATDVERTEFLCEDFGNDDCYDDIYCIAQIEFAGRCPDRNHPCNTTGIAFVDLPAKLQGGA